MECAVATAVFTRESAEVEEGGAAPGGDIAIAEEVGRSAESCWVTAFVTEETNVEIKSGDKDGWLTVGAGDATVTAGELDVVVEGAPELTTLDVLRAVPERRPQRGAAHWPCVVLCSPVDLALAFLRRKGGILKKKT